MSIKHANFKHDLRKIDSTENATEIPRTIIFAMDGFYLRLCEL